MRHPYRFHVIITPYPYSTILSVDLNLPLSPVRLNSVAWLLASVIDDAPNFLLTSYPGELE
jgi:hypothetical protein